MYTVKAIRNGAYEISVDEGYTTYHAAKERAYNLVHGSYREANIYTSNGDVRYTITHGVMEGFKEKEYNTMNTPRNKIVEIKSVRAVSDLGLKEAKDLVESMSSGEVAAWVMEHVYEYTRDIKNKASQYDDLKASNDRYMQEAIEVRKVHYNLEKENKNLLNQRNQLLTLLTKEQILDLYIASQSQTE